MNIDYEKLAREVDIELSLSSNTWPTPAEFQNAAKRVISASGLLEEVERLKKAVETLKHECAHCDSEGCVDSGGFDPHGNPIMIPCHRCHCFKIGSKWMKDSSLETWFPYTAKEVDELKAKVGRVEGLAEIWKMDASIPPRCRRSAFSASGALEMCSRQLTAALKGDQ